MSHSLYTIKTFAKVSIRRYFRDRVAIFFTVIFPLIFLGIFGGIFGKNSSTSFHVALINQSSSAFAKSFVDQSNQDKFLKIDKSTATLVEARDKMSRSELDATVVLPPSFGEIKNSQYPTGEAVVYYDQNSEQAAQTLATILKGEFEGINAKYVKTVTPLNVKTQATNQKGLTRFDYTFSGLLGFSILGLGIFGPVNYFPQMKKQGVLRRLHITPLRPWEFFVSSVLSNAVIGLFSVSIMFLVALSPLFHFHMAGNYLELGVLVIFGILSIFGIGLAIGGWAENENQAAPFANLISFPMMFLSGTFFPRFLMPEWLQHVSGYLPLTPVIDGIRLVATEGKHLTQLGPQLGLMLVWTIIIYAIAFRVFRWE